MYQKICDMWHNLTYEIYVFPFLFPELFLFLGQLFLCHSSFFSFHLASDNVKRKLKFQSRETTLSQAKHPSLEKQVQVQDPSLSDEGGKVPLFHYYYTHHIWL